MSPRTYTILLYNYFGASIWENDHAVLTEYQENEVQMVWYTAYRHDNDWKISACAYLLLQEYRHRDLQELFFDLSMHGQNLLGAEILHYALLAGFISSPYAAFCRLECMAIHNYLVLWLWYSTTGLMWMACPLVGITCTETLVKKGTYQQENQQGETFQWSCRLISMQSYRQKLRAGL